MVESGIHVHLRRRMMRPALVAFVVVCLLHHHHHQQCHAFSLGSTRRISTQTALKAFSGSSNYMDSLTRYTNYQHEQRHMREQGGFQQHQQQQQHYNEPQEEDHQPAAASTTDWNSQLLITEDRNMNVEQDFHSRQIRPEVTGQPPEEKLLDEDFERYLKMVSTEVAVKRLNNENTFAITDVPADVILGRWLDTMEDALLKFRRYEKGRPFKQDRFTIVVLGSGWAAHAFVKLASTYDLKVVVVSPVNHFVSISVLCVLYCIVLALYCDSRVCSPTFHSISIPIHFHMHHSRSLLPC